MALEARDIPPLGANDQQPLDRFLRIEQQLLAERARGARVVPEPQGAPARVALAGTGAPVAASGVAGSLLAEGTRRARDTRARNVDRDVVPAPERPEPYPDVQDVTAPHIAEYPRSQGRSAFESAMPPPRIGHVFFQAEMPDRTIVYAREGAYGLSQDGIVVSPSGAKLSPPLNVPPRVTSTTVTRTGEILVTTPDIVGTRVIGRLRAYTFPRPEGLEDIGGGLFRPTGRSGAPQLVERRTPTRQGRQHHEEEPPKVGVAAGAVNAEVARQRFKEDLAAYRPDAPMPGQVINRDL